MKIEDVNALDSDAFISLFGNIVENCSLIAAAIWSSRPFSDVDDIQNQLNKFIDLLPRNGKEGILRNHPDLAGRLAAAGQLTRESTQEQKAAGLDTLTAEEKEKLNKLNTEYKAKFGFPFVICARENKKDAILKGLEHRVQNDLETETLTGVEEVKKICRLRLLDIMENHPGAKL
ncbi:2-oxo-4-hydroxy-4-carboxy-5-ureidoimidazoline decarboxylase [Lingula anatina]|uniref:2-oxo-4-hydroxy-4-carboxy-5-ureidoimidazoline decarboxylase n=1 Tax=Lingula anatina TaxID=7574 RepID=A0A1S3H7Y6_LINAN|nr:2-oxo-4-hydroxy-4-carboxy-5-ureidoimidazoline decarboxylase [Lingula anatina]|eukprot:XP_013382230.1 2-oxo-4-hydroxy-4-carboxy-5-ureidoimidazoline decarboxylase [Lingula anatina]